MSTKQPFKNQTILITGASSGLGSEFARQLVQGGANVGLIARRESHLKELVDQISGAAPKVDFAVADVGDRNLLNSAIFKLKAFNQVLAILLESAAFQHAGGYLWDTPTGLLNPH